MSWSFVHLYSLQVCEWHHLPSLAIHTAHDVHTVPSGQSIDDRSGGFQLLLPVWPQGFLYFKGLKYGRSRRTQVWATGQRHQPSVSTRRHANTVNFSMDMFILKHRYCFFNCSNGFPVSFWKVFLKQMLNCLSNFFLFLQGWRLEWV